MSADVGLIVEILRTTGGSWVDVTGDVQSVAVSGVGAQFPQSPSPGEGKCNLVLVSDNGAYASGETIMNQGNVVRVRVVGQCGKCLHVYHTGTSGAASYIQNIGVGSLEVGTHINLTWEARSAYSWKWNTDNAYIQDGATQHFAASTQTYTNKWQSFEIDVPVAVDGAYFAVVFQPDRTGTEGWQYTEYRNIVLSLDGVAQAAFNVTGSAWEAYNPGAGTYHLSVVDDANPVFWGFIERVAADPPQFAVDNYKTVVECIDLVTRLGKGRMNAPLQRNKTTDELVRTALDYVGSNPEASWRAWARGSGARRYYALGETVGSTTAVDDGTDGLDSITVSKVTFGSTPLLSNGDTATSGSFNGTDSYIQIQGIEITRSWTVTAQINLLSGANPQAIFSFYDDNDNYYELRTELNTTADLVFDRNGTTIVADNALTYNASHHVAMTFDYASSTLTLYADGVAVADDTTTAVVNTTVATWIGRGVDTGYAASGKIQNLLIFDTCLSADEIAAAYSATQFSESKAIRWFPGMILDECSLTHDVAFDQYRENRVTPFAAIEDAVNSIGGRWYVEGDGTLRLHDTNWWLIWRERRYGRLLEDGYNTVLLDGTDPYGIGDIVKGGDRVINSVSLQYNPRTLNSGSVVTLGSANATIPPLVSGTYGTAGAVPGEETVTIYFKNDAGNAIAGYDFVTPLTPYDGTSPATPYHLRVWGDNPTMEEGTDYTPGGTDPLNRGRFCEYQILSLSPSQVKIKFKNFAIGNLYVYVSIEGYSIESFDPVSIEKKSADVLSEEVDERSYTAVLPFTSSSEFTRQYANYMVAVYGSPVEEYGAWIFQNNHTVTGEGGDIDAFAIKIGDLVGDSRLENNYFHIVTGVDFLASRAQGEESHTLTVHAARADTPKFTIYDSGAVYNDGWIYAI